MNLEWMICVFYAFFILQETWSCKICFAMNVYLYEMICRQSEKSHKASD